jgi:hypothetical protein
VNLNFGVVAAPVPEIFRFPWVYSPLDLVLTGKVVLTEG